MLKAVDFHVEQEVSPSGHRWVDVRLVDQTNWSISTEVARMIVEAEGPKGQVDRVPVSLENDSGLFFEFAKLEDEEAILGFVNRWGFLSMHEYGVPATDRRKRLAKASNHPAYPFAVDNTGVLLGETLQWVLDQVRRMRTLVNLWQAVVRKDRTTIGELVEVVELSPSGKDELGCHSVLQLRSSDATSLIEAPKPNKLLQACSTLLVDEISENLNRHASEFYVYFESATRGWGQVRIKPMNLMCGIWCQFGEAVINETRFNPCTVCGRMLAVAPGAYRSNRTLCSNACKSKAYRLRQAKATRRKPK